MPDFKDLRNSPFPLCTIDVIIRVGDKILLVRRKYPPMGWALPGGFVEKGETLEDAARREAREETGMELEGLSQFHAYSDPSRDSRFHSISVVFSAAGKGSPAAASDAERIGLFDKDSIPDDMAFDHKDIILDFLENRAF
ncbi:MAG: NUDIX hydrolase [Elusimicrobia bacterium]|nr:NUDIX hydrolase [Elusimicrobiota bacterium]